MTTTRSPSSQLSNNKWIFITPILSDNYSYFIIDYNTGNVAVVDPAEPEKVLSAFDDLRQKQPELQRARLSHILTTHKHWDHAGGNERLVQLLRERFRDASNGKHQEQEDDITVIGGIDEDIPMCTHPVRDNDTFTIGQSLHVTVLTTPCHTKGHVQYLVTLKDGDSSPALFTGDTLFIGGCGRFFEGTAQQMYDNLKRLGTTLDPKTEVYCGHEYTLKNLQFALECVEPDNEALTEKIAQCNKLRSDGVPTVPSTLEQELQYNPFMRCDEDSVRKVASQMRVKLEHVGNTDQSSLTGVDTMRILRKMKDNYK